MTFIAFKRTCLAIGALFFTFGCSPAIAVNQGTPPAQVETQAKIALNSENETVTTATASPAALDSAPLQATVTPGLAPAGPTPTSTPLVKPLPIPAPDGPPYAYHTIVEGQTLSTIALRYNTTVEELVVMNELEGPAALIQAGQLLRIPLDIDNISPASPLMPDSEVVYGPAYVDFDLDDFVNSQSGYLATYYETVNGEELTGAQVIERVAEQFSVGPRLLLGLLEYYGGWVTNLQPTAEQLQLPLGPRNPKGGSLFGALSFTANRINAGYYGYKRDGFWVFQLADRSRAITPLDLNAGTVGVQNILAIHSDRETWQRALSPTGFTSVYRKLFGDPFAYAVEPLVPITLVQPALSLPWPKGEGFYFSGAPHPAYADGSAWPRLILVLLMC